MPRTIFVSYKHGDAGVETLDCGNGAVTYSPDRTQTTARDYVTRLERLMDSSTEFIYMGEHDGEDMKGRTAQTIMRKLSDRMYDSTVTVVCISPNMKNPSKAENIQWIPREISYSLREVAKEYADPPHSNALIFLVLPDKNGSYTYFEKKDLFVIIQKNLDNGYGVLVHWNDFLADMERYLSEAESRKGFFAPYKILYDRSKKKVKDDSSQTGTEN